MIKTPTSPTNENALFFIDTNVYLDFYRNQDKELETSMINMIRELQGKLIMTEQVHMEFLKNRRPVIVDGLGNIQSPDWSRLSIPAFLADEELNKNIARAKKDSVALIKSLKDKMQRALDDPEIHDPVYKLVMDLNSLKFPSYLNPNHPEQAAIFSRAKERFMLGYPPRKDNDTSIGDAVNWEWIIHCAGSMKKSVIIVSRDSDYGRSYNGNTAINDWLKHEFHNRTDKKNITLTNTLSKAFKLLNASLPKCIVQQENEFIKRVWDNHFNFKNNFHHANFSTNSKHDKLSHDELRYIINNVSSARQLQNFIENLEKKA